MNRSFVFLGLMFVGAFSCASQLMDDPLAHFTRSWRDHPIWHDGKAEIAVYEATRSIYGKPRKYSARLYTNKEHASARTKTKTLDNQGRAVFKHHLREDVATDNYKYHFSTMCFVGMNDLKSLKIDMGSQEDCGATFKQYVNHAGTCIWSQFSYFPEEGHVAGSYPSPENLVFQDALSLILRGYPFEDPVPPINLMVLGDQTTTRHSSPEPIPMQLSYLGYDTCDLPIGRIGAYRLRLEAADHAAVHDYWFAQSARAPWLHVMVKYRGPAGLVYQLEQLERRSYWGR